MSYIGIDIGTTGCKALAFDQDGKLLAKAYREYPLLTTQLGWAELDAEEVWRAVRDNIQEIAMGLSHDPPRALAVATLGEAVVPIDAHRKPLTNSIISFDNRAIGQFKQFIVQVTSDTVFEITGLFPLSHYSIFKWMWWREQQPDLFKNIWKFLCFGDYIGVRLGLRPLMDHSMATRTLAFDNRKKTWSQDLLDVAGVDLEKLPETAPSGTIVGELPSRVATSLNLPRGIVLVLGGLDQGCAALGAGAIHPGDTLLSIGTVGAIGPVFAAPTVQMRRDCILTMPHVVPDLLFTLGATTSAGALLRWFRDQFGYEERQIARQTDRDIFEVITSLVNDRPTELLMLPHFSGSRFAFNNPVAKGALIGLTFATQKYELVRAILDSVAYELCLIRERFENAGLPITQLRAVGGGSRSDVWMQILADSVQIPIYAMQNPEAGALGAALLGHLAVDTNRSLSDTVNAIVFPRRVFNPRKEWLDYHTGRIATYRKAYTLMKDIYPLLDLSASDKT
jgi:xylulokinase